MNKILLITIFGILCSGHLFAQQNETDFSVWKTGRSKYKIAGVKVTGTKYVDTTLLIALSGLTVGEDITVPGDEKISKAIDKLWDNNLFSNVEITIDRISGQYIWLIMDATEVPRLGDVTLKGISKSEANELKGKLGLVKGRAYTQSSKKNAELAIKDYYKNKGFNAATVRFGETPSTDKSNHADVIILVNKGSRVRIENISIAGNDNVPESVAKAKLKDVKEKMRFSLASNNTDYYFDEATDDGRKDYWKNLGFLSISKTKEYLEPYVNFNFFSSAKFEDKKMKDAGDNLISYYNSLGYRDAEITGDTSYYNNNGNLVIEYKVNEGKKYYFGNFTWRGNTKFDNNTLSKMLAINKGEVYSQELLDSRIGSGAPDVENINSLYMDDGYLFFNINPVEKAIYNDTIDFELRMTEGPQAIINAITITGNDKTSDHVVRREIRTLPGNKFSRADIIRTIRELSNLGYFNPENISPQPKPNYQNGTVDIDYSVEEKSTDKLELSAGFGGSFGLFGTLGVSFNNFSLRNIAHPENWDPLPMGDGQKLSVRVQSNGKQFNSETFSFTEPWLGGKKPTALTVSFNRMFVSYANYNLPGIRPKSNSITQLGGTVAINKRVKWPDDNFVLALSLNYVNYNLHNFVSSSTGQSLFVNGFENGHSNNFNIGLGLSRYSIDNPLYPRFGSNISLNLTMTPPYSLWSNKNYSEASSAEKYKWVEYQKIKFIGEWYQKLAGNLVLKFAAKYGFMGYYNHQIGFTPFERFQVGGDGLSGYAMNYLSRDIVAQRGYPGPYSSPTGDPIFNKYTFELRYPLSLNPSSTIYAEAFFDAANSWANYRQYNPFKLNRSTGLGIRVYLPMFGLLGLDYGLGLDRYHPGDKFGGFANFTFMLGFEPQ